jgi:cytochrome c-type biogenesis protein CcmF
MLHSIRDDLYVVVGMVNADTKVATFQVHVNPLVSWIWTGVLILIGGALIAMWPEVAIEEARAWGYLRTAGALTSSVSLGILLAMMPARAFGQTSSSLHAGSVRLDDPTERALFSRLLCQCGDCARLPLASCTCATADAARSELRSKLAAGETPDQIIAEYAKEYGSAALSVPPNEGGLRGLYLVPGMLATAGAVTVMMLVRRWRRRGEQDAPGPAPAATGDAGPDDYDAKLDEELRSLDA